MLYVAGGLLQIAGVLLVASPDIFPFLRRFARWLYPRYVRLENRLRRLVGRARPQRHTIGPADEINLADSLVPVLSPSKQLSLEETVAWLVRRAENAQKEHAALARRLEEANGPRSRAPTSSSATWRRTSPRRSSRRTGSTCRSA